MNNKLLLLIFAILGAFSNKLEAQLLTACSPVSPPATTCAQSCIICDLDGVTGNNSQSSPPGSVCDGDLILNNSRWYGFIAGSPYIIIGVQPSNCQTGASLEAAVLSDCNKTLVCQPGPVMAGFGGFFSIISDQYIVGRPYQLVIDGYNGDICDFELSVLYGSTVPPAMGTLDSIVGLQQVCPNATTIYAIPPVTNALTYSWTSPPGSHINGLGSSVTLPATAGNAQINNEISVEFGNTGGNICVTAANVCSTPQTTCLPVSNTPLANTVLPDEIICYQQSPYEWPEEPHTVLYGPGTYNMTSTPYLSYLGCDSIVKQKITLLPLNQKTLPVKFLCKDDCFEINGFNYCETGTYQEILQSVNGCDSIVNFTVIKIAVNAAIVPPDTITCEITSVPLSGTGSSTGNNVTYKWLNSAGQTISNAFTATATAPGDYFLIVTKTQGGLACSDTAVVTVPGDLVPPLADAGPDMQLTCAVTQLQLQGTGSVGPNFSYFWKTFFGGNIVSGSTTLTPIVNTTGHYSLRVTDSHNGCTAVSNAIVTADTDLPFVTATGGTITCLVPTTTLHATTAAPNASYAWTGPNGFSSTLQNPVANTAGVYTVTVTNGNSGCTNTSTATVVANINLPDAVATGGAITCEVDSVTLNVTSTTQGVTYQWTGPNSFSSTLSNPVVTEAGNYQVVVGAPNGCTSTAQATVALNTTAPGATLTASGTLNCNNATTNLLAASTANPANLTHLWTAPGGGTTNTGTVATLNVNAPGVYNVLITNTTNGCTSSANYTVVQHPNVSAAISNVQNNPCFGTSTGSLTVTPTGGDGSYTYVWSTGATTATISNLGSGTYGATVTDGENCTAVATGTITTPTQVNANASATPQTANGTTDGTATANPSGGTPSYTYLWSNNDTTQTITGLAPGIYTVTVGDQNGCTTVQTVTVNQYNCTLLTNVLVENALCFGSATGTAALDITGGTSPFQFIWSNGDTTSSVQNLSAGQYTVSITDAANCPALLNFTIGQPDLLAANTSSTSTLGPLTTDGTATASPTGGTGNYSYQWSNGGSTATINNLAAGVYTVSVTDQNGCTAVQEVTVEPGTCSIMTNFLATNPSCYGLTNGSATVILTGGAGGFTYTWSNGGSTAEQTGLGAGTYTVSILDVNGCAALDSVVLTDPPLLALALDAVTPTSCLSTPAGSASVSATGGTGTLSISWSNGQSGTTANGLIAGTYTATVTDENGCTQAVEAEILALDTESPVITAGPVSVALDNSGDLVLNAQNLNATITDNCVVSSITIQPNTFDCTDIGDHEVTITVSDDGGNTATQTITVTVIDNVTPVLVCSPSLVLCAENNTVSYQSPTATDNCLGIGGNFALTEGLPSGSVFPTGTTVTTYTYTDAQGNVGSCSFEVTILTPLAITVETVTNDLDNQHVGAIFINVAGSLSPYTYAWTLNGVPFANTQDITGLAGGEYAVVVTDDNGCTVASQTIVVQNLSETGSVGSLGKIQIFPNPTSGFLNIVVPDDLTGRKVQIQVFDMTGRRTLERNKAADKHMPLDLSGLPEGVYTIMFRVDDQQLVRKIVVSGQ